MSTKLSPDFISTLIKRLRKAAERSNQAGAAAHVAGMAPDSTDDALRNAGVWLADVAEEFSREVGEELDELCRELESIQAATIAAQGAER